MDDFMDPSNRPDHPQTAEVFTDVLAHRQAAEIIRRHSTNREDIRTVSLEGLPLGAAKNILDLGCGFGFFTEALKRRVHRDAYAIGIDIVAGYEPFFLETLEKAWLAGEFRASGAGVLKSLADRQFDLILCSYALYFFPEILPEIPRVLKRSGTFITITHRTNNMGAVIGAIQEILVQKGSWTRQPLPIQGIIAGFCAENGLALLKPWFGKTQAIDFPNALIFREEEIQALLAYFRYKSPFFLSGMDLEAEAIGHLLQSHLRQRLGPEDSFVMTKDDTIFICSDPLPAQQVRHGQKDA